MKTGAAWRARIQTALLMVSRRPARSVLAALGAAVTLAALHIAVSVADRGRKEALNEIRRMGATVLIVNAEQSRNRGGRARTGLEVKTLTLRDAREVERLVPGVALVAGEYRAVIPVKAGDLARQTTISEIEPSYAALRDAPMQSGRFFSLDGENEGQRVAVLGARVARDLHGGLDAVGQPIRLRGIPFTVIGILPDRGTGLDAFDEDEVVFNSLKTARRRLFQVDYLQRLFIRAAPSANLVDVAASIVATLAARHRGGDPAPPDFRVQDQRRLVALQQTAIDRLGTFQVEVTVALLVAGAAGVFALQLLSVRERTAEIGTRRALGATRGMIFGQFLLESCVVIVTGGVLGVGLGLGVGSVAVAAVAPALALGAFLACLACGLLAAVEPARRASGVPPALALRAQ